MVTAEIFVSALGAAGVGTIAGHLIAGARDRREARARVFDSIAKVETARWGAASLSEVQLQVHSAASAMLLARVPRPAARRYLVLAYAGALMADETARSIGESHIDMALADRVQEALGSVALLVWHPWWGRMVYLLKRPPALPVLVGDLRTRGDAIGSFISLAEERVVV